MWDLRHRLMEVQDLQSHSQTLLENELSNLTLDKIENELRLMNANLAEANDIAMLQAFSAMPADLDNDSRKALRRLRDKMMARAVSRADS
jgi:hypothetical protein